MFDEIISEVQLRDQSNRDHNHEIERMQKELCDKISARMKGCKVSDEKGNVYYFAGARAKNDDYEGVYIKFKNREEWDNLSLTFFIFDEGDGLEVGDIENEKGWEINKSSFDSNDLRKMLKQFRGD